MAVKRTFTLLEIVLALAIFSVIATLAGSILFSSQQGWSVVRESSAELETLQRLDRDRRHGVPQRDSVPLAGRKQPEYAAVPRQAGLSAPRISAPGERPGGGRLRFLELSREESELVARYRRYPIIADHDGECRREVIASGVRRLAFSYAFRENGEIAWQPEFDAEAAETIPAAIRMDVEFENGRKVSFLRRTAGNSAVSSYGKFREETYGRR